MEESVKTTIQRLKQLTSTNPLITPRTIEILNKRIEQEEYSSRVYLAMSMWLSDKGYTGAAKLWRKYSNEELSHAEWAREHLLAYGVQPNTPALSSPEQTFGTLCDIVKKSFDHEVDITRQCIELGRHGLAEGDLMVHELSLKFLHEQREELDKMQTFLDKLETFGEDKVALRFLDNEMREL